MKKKLLTLASLLAVFSGMTQVAYNEDFNDSNGGWTVESGIDWEWGSPSAAAINYEGDDCGANAWVTNLDGNYVNSANSIVTSPTIDCSALGADPILSFSLNYLTESCCDEGWVEFSLDDGATWTKLIDGGGAIGWYNDTFNQWWDGTNGGWSIVSNTIPGAAGVATVKIRFHLSTDSSVMYEGFGFDNVVVSSEFESASMNGVTNIMTGLTLTDSENIEISVTNNTLVAITDLNVCYTVNGAAAVCETIGTVLPGANLYTFTATEDFSLTGEYEIITYLEALPSDFNNCDDTSVVNILLMDPISEFPYVESFEGVATFSAEGTWEIGTPIDGSEFDNPLSCGADVKVLGTTINGDYPNSVTDYAYSPFFDFSGFVTDPYIVIDIYRNTESCCDEGWIDFSIDGGATWSRFGSFGTGYNWYNDSFNQWWDGSNGGWEYAYQQATGLAGEANVRFRMGFSSDGSVTYPGIAIDNFTIQEEEPVLADGVPIALTLESDYVTCGFTGADFLVATYTNVGVDSLFGYTICYDLGAGPVCVEFADDTLLPGETFMYTFEEAIDLTDALSHDITISISSESETRDCGGKVYTLATTVVGLKGETSVTDISCNGESDGQIYVNPQFGTPGYGVTWESGDAGFVLGDLAVGYHVYTITDANGCTFTDSAEVIEPDGMVLTSVVSHDYEEGNGAIDLTVVGGTAPYTFDWDNDGLGDYDAEDITGLTAGTYTVIVTDANGCTETITVSVLNTVGVNEFELGSLNVYPNPTNGAFQIAIDNVDENEYNLVIFSLLGEVVYSDIIVNSTTSINAGELEAGVYLVQISSENASKTVRLVVQ